MEKNNKSLTATNKIRMLEASLHKTKTNFIFSKIMGTESLSPEKDGEVRFSLSWERNEIQKKYRLFLIEKEYLSETKKEEVVFRRPLIECPLDIRHYWGENLVPFMDSFTEYLKEYRLSVINGLDIMDKIK